MNSIQTSPITHSEQNRYRAAMKAREQASASLKIAIADDERDIRLYFCELLPPLGHEVVAMAETGKELIAQCRSHRPQLIITDVKLPDIDGIQAAAEINREYPVPVILVTAYHDADLIERAQNSHIMAYLTKPVRPVDIQAAISLAMVRFGHFQALQSEAADLRHALEDRKLIEQAKGIVMKRLRVEEEEAFRRLRNLASDRNKKITEIGRDVCAAEEVFRALEAI